MTTSAFQENAFQNNAFQTNVDTHDGLGDSWLDYHRKKKKEAEQLRKKYKDAVKKLPKTKALVSAVDSYVSPINQEELEKRYRAEPIFQESVPIGRIDFNAIAQNDIAIARFNQAIEAIKLEIVALLKLQLEEEEFALLMMLIGI